MTHGRCEKVDIGTINFVFIDSRGRFCGKDPFCPLNFWRIKEHKDYDDAFIVFNGEIHLLREQLY